ncbi:MAG: enoyl-CoA hydratase/isomerase family protein, partial [Bacillota bacterium]
QVKAIIITGSGLKAFNVGADIDWLEGLDSDRAREVSRKGNRICNLIEGSPKVVIATVNGYALGGGMELALACDIRIASTRARFGQPEVGLGIVPGFAGTQRLPQLIGIGRAKEMLFTGEIIDAEHAYEIGLVNRLVTPRDLLKESRDLALKISEQSQEAVRLIKNSINRGQQAGKEAGIEYEREAFAGCFKSREHLERIRRLRKELNSSKMG